MHLFFSELSELDTQSKVAWLSSANAYYSKIDHYENTPIQIYGKFHLQKLKIFR